MVGISCSEICGIGNWSSIAVLLFLLILYSSFLFQTWLVLFFTQFLKSSSFSLLFLYPQNLLVSFFFFF